MSSGGKIGESLWGLLEVGVALHYTRARHTRLSEGVDCSLVLYLPHRW